MTTIITAKLYDATGAYLTELPAFQTLQIGEQLNTENSWQMTYDLQGTGANLLVQDQDLEVAFLTDGTEVFRGVIEEDNWDEVISEGAILTLAGRGEPGMLQFALVYPNGGIGHTPASHAFVNATPGQIFKTLFLEAQARGNLPTFSLSFDNTLDSSGNAWTTLITITYNAGLTLLDLIKSLGASNQADFRMTGNVINMYNPKTTLGASPNVTFRRGLDILSAPRSRSRRSLQTVSFVQGDNDKNVERVDSVGVAARGRKEGFTSQGGITDTGTLNGIGDNILSVYSAPRLSKTHTLSFDPNTTHPRPWIDYKPGDYVKTDLSGTIETYRVISLTVSLGSSGPIAGEVTLNDVFAEREVMLANQVNALGGGGFTTSAPSPGTPTTPPVDGTIPGIPTLNSPFQTQTYLDGSGISKSRVILTWGAPLNTDGSIIIDGDHYEIQYRMNTSVIYPQTWAAISATPWNALNTWQQPFTATTQDWQTGFVSFSETSYTIQELATGLGYDVRIRAVDGSNNAGAWSSIDTFLTNADNIAPSTPDAPTVAASLIAVQVTHDLGRATGGTFNLEQDLHHLEIHSAYEPTFTPSSATLLGKLPATQGMIEAQVPAVGTFNVASTTTVYVRVIAVDLAGNRSGPSVAASSTALLIDDAHISTLTVSKVTAGTISADFIVGARIKTADSGNRVELSPMGLLAYDASGAQTVSISSVTGDASITGTFSSGLAADRVVVNPAGSSVPSIVFYPTTGVNTSNLYSRGDLFPGEATFFIDSGSNGVNSAHYEQAAGFMDMHIYDIAHDSGGGGLLQLGINGGFFQFNTNTGTGGELVIRDTTVNLDALKASSTIDIKSGSGGSTYIGSQGGSSYTQIYSGAAGSSQLSIALDNSNRVIALNGRFYNYTDQGSGVAVFCASVGYGAVTSAGYGYGSTQSDGKAVVAALYNSTGVLPNTVTGSSSTGFSFSTTGAGTALSRVFAWVFAY